MSVTMFPHSPLAHKLESMKPIITLPEYKSFQILKEVCVEYDYDHLKEVVVNVLLYQDLMSYLSALFQNEDAFHLRVWVVSDQEVYLS